MIYCVLHEKLNAVKAYSIFKLMNYTQMYIDGLYPFIFFSSFLGFFNGLTVYMDGMFAHKTNNDFFINMVGHTSIGIMTGICYPITYPLLGYYVLHKKLKIE